MPIDINRARTIIDVLRSFNSTQWAVVLFLVIGGIWSVWQVENRYAKIMEVEQRFQQSQQQLESAYFLAIEMFGRLSEAERRQIMEKLELARQKKTNPNKHSTMPKNVARRPFVLTYTFGRSNITPCLWTRCAELDSQKCHFTKKENDHDRRRILAVDQRECAMSFQII